eukprot:136302_1
MQSLRTHLNQAISKTESITHNAQSKTIINVRYLLGLFIMSLFAAVAFTANYYKFESVTLYGFDNNIVNTNHSNNLNHSKPSTPKRIEYLVLQCMALDNIGQIQRYLDIYSFFIETIEYYAWYHKYKYHMEFVNMNDMASYLSLYHTECRSGSIVCRKMWKIWCLERVLLKFNPKWLIHFDLDMAIVAPHMFTPLDVFITHIAAFYNYTSLEDISFICSDGMNTGIMIFNNQNYKEVINNKYYNLFSDVNKLDLFNYGNKVELLWESQYKINVTIGAGTPFDSPFVQSFFDLNKYVWFRDEHNTWMTDQIAIMEVLLVIAGWWYDIENNINEKTYDYTCIKTKHRGPDYNACWW